MEQKSNGVSRDRGMLALSACLVVLGSVAAAQASSSTPLVWAFQTVSNDCGFYASTVAMRDGQAWPVVITDGPSLTTSGTYGKAYSLFPVSNPNPGPTMGSNWWDVGSGFYSGSAPQHLRSTSSSDGRVAFAGWTGPNWGGGAYVSSTSGGWAGVGSSVKAVAFSGNGTLYTATDTSVTGLPALPSSAGIVDIAVSKSGSVGAITADGKYWQYGGWLNTWGSATLSGNSNYFQTSDVAFDGSGRPHVVTEQNNTIYAYDFDTITGQWHSSVLASGVRTGDLMLATSPKGTVGTAWVDASQQLVYAYKEDDGLWQTSAVTQASAYQGLVGIDYDYAGLPVLSYKGTSSGGESLMVAYDPISLVPEPTSLGIIAVGTFCLVRRRRAE